MCDDRTMLPYGLMVEVAFICELATCVARFKIMQRRTYVLVSVSCESMIIQTAV